MLLAAWLALGCGAEAPVRPPNVVLIVADDLGIGEVGAYGGEEIPTPSIDAISSGATTSLPRSSRRFLTGA